MVRLEYNKKVGLAHLFLCLFLIWSHICIGQNPQRSNRPTIIDAYNDILKLKIKKGREALDKITPDVNSLGHYYYVKNLADILELLLNEDTKRYKDYDDNEDIYLKEIKKMDDSDPFKLFYTAEIKLQWAIVKVQYGDELKAGIGLRSAWNTIQKNKSAFPEFSTNYKTLGLLHIVFGAIPEGYHWILKILGIRGDIMQGMRELDLVPSQSPFTLECEIIQSVAAINILKESESTLKNIEWMLLNHKDNLLINYIYCVTLIKYSKSEAAFNRLSRLLFLSDSYMFINLIFYQLGEVYIQKQDYIKARAFYSKFLNQHKGKNHLKDSWFKTALTYWLDGNEKLAEVHFEEADDTGKAFISADKNANGILNEDKLPNPELMKIRLATDGGYFDAAESILSRLNEGMFESKKDKAIYYYRQGRLKHKKEEFEGAIYFYLFSIKKAGNENWYYAPSACLQTGYIYLDKGDKEKARFYFEKALTYKKHKYKSEIDIKAKAALESLGKVEKKKKKKN